MTDTKRKTLNHPQLIRISKIHTKILAETYPNSNELAKDLETSVVTISRDIEFMRDSLLAPIEYDPAKRGYHYTEKFDIPNYCMSEKDVEVLTSAKILLSHFKNTPLYDEACSIINLLSQTVIKNKEPDYINRLALPSHPQIRYDRLIWNTLWDAVKQNRIVEFDYTGRWQQETKHRRVRPYQLLMDEGVFLFGFSEEADAERLFSLSRIKNLTVTEDHFDLPEDFTFESRCGGGKFGAFCSDRQATFRIEFYEEARPLIRELVLADDEILLEDDEHDTTVAQFSSTQYYRILEWLLGFGCTARPVEPEWFVDMWKEDVKKLGELAGV